MPIDAHRRRALMVMGKTAPWTPQSLGPELWFDAHTLVSQSGLTDGSAVASWPSTRSMLIGKAATQATGANQPTLRTGANGINNQPAVEFDGNDVLAVTATAAEIGQINHTVFVVVKAPTIPTSDQVVFGGGVNWWVGAGNTGVVRTSHARSSDSAQITATGSQISFDSTPSLINWRILAPVELAVDNLTTTLSTTYPDAFLSATAGTWFLGGLDATPTLPFVGLLAEFLVFNIGLSNGNRDSVMGYLRAKYQIT